MRYDLLVIGAGPAGWSAALQGSKLGLTVAVVEKQFFKFDRTIKFSTIDQGS